MNKYSIFIAILLLFVGGRTLAQSNPDRDETEKDKRETVKTEDKQVAGIKVVPPAKNKHAKPTKVSSARPRTARPGADRPARNGRPSARPVRPGNGRN